MSVNCVCPTLIGAVELYGLLSLTVSLKAKVLATELNASVLVAASPPVNGPETFKPAKIVASLGKYLVDEDVGENDTQFGPEALVILATLLVPDTVELSFCSQLYVKASPSASVADPVKANGVLIGIV